MNRFNKTNAEIGARIKEIRLKRNLTQEALAEKADISNTQQISNIERGLSGLSVGKLKDVCIALDIDADYLLFGISSKNVETVLHKFISDMTDEQISNLIEIVKAYAKTCDINLADK